MPLNLAETTAVDEIAGLLHDATDRIAWGHVLAPDSYVESQRLAGELLAAGSLGLVYPSVRDRRGTCYAQLSAGAGRPCGGQFRQSAK